ncbi:MAG: RHS repeat-associated core domain-containing protein, partial [Acidobacteriota bacterium]
GIARRHRVGRNTEGLLDAEHPIHEDPPPSPLPDPTTTYSYDALDRLITVEQPFGITTDTVTTSYTYDVQDHLVEVVDGEGTITNYVYSDRDLMTQETSEVSGVTAYTYTDSGQLATRTDARGITETRSYDVLDRVTSVDYPDDSLDITYAYDDPGLLFGIGRLGSITRDGHAIAYNYDRFGRTTQDGDLSYTYDLNSNRSTISYAGGGMSTYTFDYADREATLSYDAGAGAQSIVTSASYLPSGPLDGLTFGNGLEEIRPYDSRYFPAEIQVVDSMMTDLLHWSYTVDRVGNPTSIVDMLDATNDRTYEYQDHQYFLTRGDGPWGDFAWTYDTIGNRLTEIKDGGFTDLYSYLPNSAAAGNLPKLDQITVSGGIRTFQYDAAGNQTQVSAGGNVIDRSYDDAGRMALQERTSAEASSEFFYDGRSFLRSSFGREPAAPGAGIFCDGFESGDTSAWDIPGGGSTCLESLQTGPLYDSTGLLHSVEATRVLYFAGRPVAQFGAEALYLTTDHLGTPIQATDDLAAVSWEGGFEPFGTDYSGAQAAGIFLRFPGQWEDAAWGESGVGDEVSYNVHRWYQRTSGRYSTSDPIWSGRRREELNNYLYVSANPLKYFDPIGLQKTSVCCNAWDSANLPSLFRQVTDLQSYMLSTGPDPGPLEVSPFARTSCDGVSAYGGGEPDTLYENMSQGACVNACVKVHEQHHRDQCRKRTMLQVFDSKGNLDEAVAYAKEASCLMDAINNGYVEVDVDMIGPGNAIGSWQ